MPFLLAEILNFQGSTHRIGVGSFSHLLIDKGMTNAELMEQAGFSANIITRIKRDNYSSLDSIEKICKTLQCGVDDILEFTPEKEK